MADFGARWNSVAAAAAAAPKRARRDFGPVVADHHQNGWGGLQTDAGSNPLPYGTLSTDLINAVTSGLGLGVANAFGAAAAATTNEQQQTVTNKMMMGYEAANTTTPHHPLPLHPLHAHPAPPPAPTTTPASIHQPSLHQHNLHADVLPPDASATLFVDGLPSDCSRREAAHIFRPFIGFKEVRLVHKDGKRAVNGDKLVLCFVEFVDAKCAATALEALQGYKFDENDPDSYVLRLTFARYGPRGGGPAAGLAASSVAAAAAATSVSTTPGSARSRSPRGRDRSPYSRRRRAAPR